MNYSDLCEKIMSLDESIRFAGVYTSQGEMISNQMRKNTDSLLTEEQVKMSMYYAKLRHQTRVHLENQIGKEEFSLTKYEKMIRFTIPFEKDLILVSADNKADYQNLIDKIIKTIKE